MKKDLFGRNRIPVWVNIICMKGMMKTKIGMVYRNLVM